MVIEALRLVKAPGTMLGELKDTVLIDGALFNRFQEARLERIHY